PLQPRPLPRSPAGLGGGVAGGAVPRPRLPRGARAARRRAPPAHAPGRDTRCGASPGAGGDRARRLPARRARRRRRGAHRRRRRVHRLAAHARPAAPLPRPRAAAPHPLMEVTREQVRDGLRAARYLTTPRVETALFLALVLEKPLLAEGPAGAGKAELAKLLAEMLRTDLVRLQCYEGLDEARALCEWHYQKQLLRIQTDRAEGRGWDEVSHHIFSREFLLDRPLLHAITAPRQVVLLIDEVDKADPEFEAFLLEVLSDFQVS